MNKISILLSFIMLVNFAGCSNTILDSSIHTPITIPLETLISEGSISPQSFNNDTTDLLEKTMDSIIVKTQTKGISAAVLIPNKGTWVAARGGTGNELNEDMTTDLRFYAGSIGKIFTAVVVLRLIEEGQLSLESTVDRWFPEIRQANRITINHLLTHTSGIPGFDNLKEYEANKYRYNNPEEIIQFIKNKELLFKPGEHYAYSNIGYVMLGTIIEQVTEKSYKEAVEQYIIHRISLLETDVVTQQLLENLIVRGHHNGELLNESDDYVIPFAAGAIIATPKDLILFFQALMNGKLLTQNSLQEMFSNMNIMDVTQHNYYGKGIVAAIGTPIGDIIGHTGGIRGFGAALYYHPKKNLFVSVMMNDDIESIDPAMFRLMETIMEE